MKNIIVIAVALFAFTACGNNDKNHNDSTHVHEDGTIHQITTQKMLRRNKRISR